MVIDPVSFVGLAGVPLIAGLVEAIKSAFPSLPSGWWPLLAIACGVGLNVLVALVEGTPVGVAVIVGLVAGMAASGLYTWVRLRTGN